MRALPFTVSRPNTARCAPDEMFFMAGPTRAPKPLVTIPEVRVKRSHRRIVLSRHGHPSI